MGDGVVARRGVRVKIPDPGCVGLKEKTQGEEEGKR